MTAPLRAFVAAGLDAPLAPEVAAAGREIAGRLGGIAVLFYGSVLRTGDLDGVLDFYVLTRAPRSGVGRWLWPDVSFQEVALGRATVRAKVAVMPLATFRRAAGGRTLDTTIWARFVQPAALVWTADDGARSAVIDAVAAAAVTASRFAAALGPGSGETRDYWRALFRQTYRAEFRVERPGREGEIVAFARDRYDALLPLAWDAGGIVFERDGPTLTPRLRDADRRRLGASWASRRRLGKPLNVARLVKAAFTFEGATRYAAWKLERHTGLRTTLTPWRERHPILAAPGVLWRLWRSSARP